MLTSHPLAFTWVVEYMWHHILTRTEAKGKTKMLITPPLTKVATITHKQFSLDKRFLFIRGHKLSTKQTETAPLVGELIRCFTLASQTLVHNVTHYLTMVKVSSGSQRTCNFTTRECSATITWKHQCMMAMTMAFSDLGLLWHTAWPLWCGTNLFPLV